MCILVFPPLPVLRVLVLEPSPPHIIKHIYDFHRPYLRVINGRFHACLALPSCLCCDRSFRQLVSLKLYYPSTTIVPCGRDTTTVEHRHTIRYVPAPILPDPITIPLSPTTQCLADIPDATAPQYGYPQTFSAPAVFRRS